MESKVKTIVKIVKYIDYCYLKNYIDNTLSHSQQIKQIEQNNWRIFSNCFYDENKNLLNFLTSIKKFKSYLFDNVLLSIHIFNEVCKKYAHLIENYTCLYGIVYLCVNNKFNKINEKNIPDSFVEEFFNLSERQVKFMSKLVKKFMQENEINFGNDEKKFITNHILCN
jgi:hypothetical protein